MKTVIWIAFAICGLVLAGCGNPTADTDPKAEPDVTSKTPPGVQGSGESYKIEGPK
jgi:uncharacterized protein YceK